MARANWAMCIYRRKLRRILRKRAARSCCSRPPRQFVRSTARMRRRSAFFTLPAESGRPRLRCGGLAFRPRNTKRWPVRSKTRASATIDGRCDCEQSDSRQRGNHQAHHGSLRSHPKVCRGNRQRGSKPVRYRIPKHRPRAPIKKFPSGLRSGRQRLGTTVNDARAQGCLDC